MPQCFQKSSAAEASESVYLWESVKSHLKENPYLIYRTGEGGVVQIVGKREIAQIYLFVETKFHDQISHYLDLTKKFEQQYCLLNTVTTHLSCV